MKVGDKVWVETNWQQQLEGEPLIVEGRIVILNPALVTIDWGTTWRATFNRHAVCTSKEDIVKRVRERLLRKVENATIAVAHEQEGLTAAERELRDFEEKYG